MIIAPRVSPAPPAVAPLPEDGRPGRLGLRGLLLFDLAALLVVGALLALGTWQVQRLSWKEALIARVEARIHAAPVAAPGRERWPAVTAADDEYLHVALRGRFLDGKTTFVQAVTDYGGGYWALTPLRSEDGTLVLVNRGFVPPDRRDPARWDGSAPGAVTELTGLLRVTEPGGAFLRVNDPAANWWYSRDVAAIAAARGLTEVAPYFVDADRGPGAALPVAGLTAVRFPNNHLVYAVTWFVLAAMLAAATAYVNLGFRKAGRPPGRHASDPSSA